jgi:hypothetical protein
MKPDSGDDPYAPPAADRSPQVPAGGINGFLWRVEGDRLLVRPGAVLPEVCLVDGTSGLRGIRVPLAFRPFSLSSIFVPTEVITVFRSKRTVLRGLCLLIGGPVSGTVAGVISSIVMTGDFSATTGSISVSISLMVFGVAVPFWKLRRFPAINTAEAQGWHEVRNVHSDAIARLEELQQRMPPSMQGRRVGPTP